MNHGDSPEAFAVAHGEEIDMVKSWRYWRRFFFGALEVSR